MRRAPLGARRISPLQAQQGQLKVVVTGANSSVGLNLLDHLARLDGTEVLACVRSERAAAQIPDLPGVRTRVASYDDDAGLAEAMADAQGVVHLAGILIERKGQSYESANVGTAAATAKAAAKAGADHVLLVSVIGADPASRNPYFRSKGESELAMASEGVPCTVLRTPILIGPGTAGAASLVRSARAGRARLLGGGSYTMRPLDLDDLSRAIASLLEASPTESRTYELVGPEPVAYRDLVGRMAGLLGTRITVRATPIWLAKLGAFVSSTLSGGGMSPAVIDVITADEVVAHNADTELGLSLTPLAETLRKIVPSATDRAE